MPIGIKGNDVIAYATLGNLESVYVPPPREDIGSIMLLNSPSAVIAEYITATIQSFTDPDAQGSWPLFISHLPDSPDEAAVIKDSPGILDGRLMDSGEVIQHFGLQIRLRSNDSEEGWKKIEALALELDGTAANTLVIKNETTYSIQNLSRSTPIIPLDREVDKKRRVQYLVNYLLSITEEV